MKYLKLKMDFDKIVSRTVVVPADLSLAFLHGVIQDTFGWLDYHQYEFTIPGDRQHRNWTDLCEVMDSDDKIKYLEAAEMPISKLFGKKGAKITYTYDFGDGNEVAVESLGSVAKPDRKDFATEGPDVVEDSAGMGGIEGIVRIAKKGKGKDYEALKDWLWGAFGKCVEHVLDYPDAGDIYSRVFKLVKAVATANPKAPCKYWLDYIVRG